MDVEIFRAKDGAIEFWKENTDFMFYDIAKGEQQRGLDYWLDHLRYKNWFTDEVRQDFITVWNMWSER